MHFICFCLCLNTSEQSFFLCVCSKWESQLSVSSCYRCLYTAQLNNLVCFLFFFPRISLFLLSDNWIWSQLMNTVLAKQSFSSCCAAYTIHYFMTRTLSDKANTSAVSQMFPVDIETVAGLWLSHNAARSSGHRAWKKETFPRCLPAGYSVSRVYLTHKFVPCLSKVTRFSKWHLKG